MEVREIDYSELEKLSNKYGVSFDKLCERAEKNQELIPAQQVANHDDPNWIGYHGAADIMGAQPATLFSLFTQLNDLDYWGVQWKSRSLNNPLSKRGCGVLFWKADVEEIKRISQVAKISLMNACRVFQAITRGQI